jgi:hypothetical protein
LVDVVTGAHATTSAAPRRAAADLVTADAFICPAHPIEATVVKHFCRPADTIPPGIERAAPKIGDGRSALACEIAASGVARRLTAQNVDIRTACR